MSSTDSVIVMPGNQCMQHCCKISITGDKPIMLDYWADSHESKVVIGVREGGEKLLVKNESEYTSPIAKIYKVDSEYIIMTENSIYIVSDKIATRRIS
jgi:hypothetical protein